MVVDQEREGWGHHCFAIHFFSITPAAKPGPYSTKEHCTSRRWVWLNLGKGSTEIAHDKIEPQSTALVIRRQNQLIHYKYWSEEAKWDIKTSEFVWLFEGFALLCHINICDGQILDRSVVEKLQLQYVISDERYRCAIFWLRRNLIIVSYTVTRLIQRRLS